MRDARFFTYPVHDWQRRYEALRASFVERLPAAIVAERFGYTSAYVRLLRHQFRHGQLDFSEPVPEGKAARRRVSSHGRQKIIAWRTQRLSAGEIAELLSEEGVEISIRTVERVLAEEGFPKLPRRTRMKLGHTVKGAQIPEASESVTLGELDGCRWGSAAAGVFLFAPFLSQLNIREVVRQASLPGTKVIPAQLFPFVPGLEAPRHRALRPCRRPGFCPRARAFCRSQYSAQMYCPVHVCLLAG